MAYKITAVGIDPTIAPFRAAGASVSNDLKLRSLAAVLHPRLKDDLLDPHMIVRRLRPRLAADITRPHDLHTVLAALRTGEQLSGNRTTTSMIVIFFRPRLAADITAIDRDHAVLAGLGPGEQLRRDDLLPAMVYPLRRFKRLLIEDFLISVDDDMFYVMADAPVVRRNKIVIRFHTDTAAFHSANIN